MQRVCVTIRRRQALTICHALFWQGCWITRLVHTAARFSHVNCDVSYSRSTEKPWKRLWVRGSQGFGIWQSALQQSYAPPGLGIFSEAFSCQRFFMVITLSSSMNEDCPRAGPQTVNVLRASQALVINVCWLMQQRHALVFVLNKFHLQPASFRLVLQRA